MLQGWNRLTRAFTARAAGVSAICCVSAAGGCATTVTTTLDDSQNDRQRAELAQSVAALSHADWASVSPAKLQRATMLGRLTGGVSGYAQQPDQAAASYARSLADASGPLQTLIDDADRTADAAAALAARAESAFDGASPDMRDVGVIEAAIQNVRFARTVFLSSIDLIDRPEEERALARLAVRGRFDAAAIRLSALADAAADAAFDAKFSKAGITPAQPATADMSAYDDGPGR